MVDELPWNGHGMGPIDACAPRLLYEDLTLTSADLQKYLSRPWILRHEVLSIMQGMRPLGRELVRTSLLDEEICALQRMLEDERNGKISFPMRGSELKALLESDGLLSFCDALALALMPTAPPQAVGSARANSAGKARASVAKIMTDAVDKLLACGYECSPTSLPGTKEPYLQFLCNQSPYLRHLAKTTLEDHLRSAGFRWRKAGRGTHQKETNDRIAFALSAEHREP
jgi:hypothetical protein